MNADIARDASVRHAPLRDTADDAATAITMLQQASRDGDPAAMTELAHLLLAGELLPADPRQALSLLHHAALGGNGRAMARLAALTAGGVLLPQDWTRALQLLGHAAAAGDASAQGQLSCLQVPDAPPSDWHSMAAAIPLQYWLRHPYGEKLHDNVYRIEELAPPSVCNWLIGRAQGRLQPALVYDSVSRANLQHEMRSNSMAVYNAATFDVVQFLVQSRMSLACGYPMQHFEEPTILHYEVGQQIKPHFDFIDAQAPDYVRQIRERGQRMVTFLLYLNDDYEGGETTFPELGIVNRGSSGSGLFFINAHPDLSPDRRMLHTGSPPTRGQKWIVTQFIVSKRLRP